MDFQLLKKLNAERAARRAVIHVTGVDDDDEQLVLEQDDISGELGEAVVRAFNSGKSSMVEIAGRRQFLNVYVPPARIVVIGAVHISQALAPMAKLAGFDVRIIDPRTAFATEARFADVDLAAEWPDEALKAHPLDAYTALAALTHDPKIDDYPLQAAIDAQCFYVGALGSRKTHASRVARLVEAGKSEAEIGRISAPIGLDIGAASPSEIAVAILADIIQALRKRKAVAP
ncbi:MAG: hypothetical protein MnENMB40S_35760 [Rhizobiaceae bacterium MnEN-MB40S]|nr:MAG: hypothetical protein MnENMB40S_35760 [Rhizobiaceae bacterium MnEN-MB40S]